MATRPTADRVRESLFNIMGAATGYRVLDLFAGAGTLGLEALSRGASAAVFVDKGPPAMRALRDNIRLLGWEARCTCLQTEAARALRQLERGNPTAARFDWVFLDPPYATDFAARSLDHLGAGTLLAAEALVVVEHDRRRPPEAGYGVLARADCRVYGDTALSFYRRIVT